MIYAVVLFIPQFAQAGIKDFQNKVYAENQKYALRYAVIMMQKRQMPEPYKVYSISCL